MIGGGVAAAVLFLGVGAGLSMARKSDSEPAKGSAAPSTTSGGSSPAAGPSPSASPGTTAPLADKLKSRTTDPQPLTLGEVFKNRSFSQGGRRYTITARRADRTCAKAVHGTALVAALRKGGCTQVLRATFARSDGKLIGTIGVANLKTESVSIKAERAAMGADSYVEPLPGSGTTSRIGRGSALGRPDARGHYLILSWVQYPSGKKVPASDRELFSTFEANVILGSNLGTALQYRGIAGKPFGT